MKKIMLAVCIAASVLAAQSCGQKGGVKAIDPKDFNTAVAPGEDFYEYATGGWQRNNPLKPEYSRYGSFDILAENNQINLNELFKELAASTNEKGTEAQKIADLYTMGLDSVRLNKEGAAAVLPLLKELEGVVDTKTFAQYSGRGGIYGLGSVYGAGVQDDLMDSKNNILYIGESGLSLGNRDYYLLPEHEAIRKGYRDYLEKIFTLAGYGDAAVIADDAFAVEMAIAEPTWSQVQQRDVEASYNPTTSAALFKAYPNLHLDLYLAELGIPAQDKLILEQPSYFEALNKMFKTIDPVKLRHYLQAQLLDGAANYLSDDFIEASFDFYSKQMSGVQEQRPRWKRAMSVPNGVLGEAVGKLYVEKYFPESYKQRMLDLVHNLQGALSDHIKDLEWMSDETKARAQEKLSTFHIKIGYPDKWKDYSTLEIDPSLSYFENMRRVSAWNVADNLSNLGKPVDKEKWFMSPQTVNAYYNPTSNEICFPAGILQPPFFYPEADDAVNYGAIGVVICHEMTHGFDDQGRLFDKDGNMSDWWTPEDNEAFKAKAAILVNQFNEVEVLPGVHADGALTLGENIADHGGLSISYSALMKTLEGKEAPLIDGFTPAQRFYLAYARVWAQNITDQAKQRQTLTDPHSLGENRVNVSVRNFQSFFDAFGIKEGDKMYRPESERVIIW
ncbi:MAG: M13 family metallopeptidase [Bacteroidales bacterium]|nr:M13 family metallopeptidase [Bacteroidales bacterium]